MKILTFCHLPKILNWIFKYDITASAVVSNLLTTSMVDLVRMMVDLQAFTRKTVVFLKVRAHDKQRLLQFYEFKYQVDCRMFEYTFWLIAVFLIKRYLCQSALVIIDL